jgi:hypothetical protein
VLLGALSSSLLLVRLSAAARPPFGIPNPYTHLSLSHSLLAACLALSSSLLSPLYPSLAPPPFTVGSFALSVVGGEMPEREEEDRRKAE